MLGTSIMVIVLTALLGSFFGQSTLNQNARNMMSAMNDATRVMEEIRRQNATSVTGSLCAQSNIPSARPPSGQNWNLWFNAQSPGKSLQQAYELVVVTCQDGNSTAYCGSNQVGTQEWRPWYQGSAPPSGWPVQEVNTSFDPIRVTVAVGWSQRQPVGTIGGINSGLEFTFHRPQLRVGPDADGDRVIESPAMLTTMVTCR